MNMDLKHHGIQRKSYEAEQKPSFIKTFAIIIAVIAGGFLTYNFYNRVTATYAIPYKVIARLDQKTLDLVARANEEPCNLAVANMLATRLANQAEFAATSSFLDYVESKCKLDEDLTALKFIAQKGSSDFDGAEDTANKILKEHPSSAKVYQFRYEARKGKGDVKGSYEDLSKVLDLMPNPAQAASWVYYDLAHLAAKLDMPCEAVNTLRDYIAYDQVTRRTPQLESLLEKWQKEGNCQSPFGKGSARFVYDRGAPSVILPVTINGVKTRMIIDTGASRTLLTKELAQQAGIKPSHQSGALVATVDKISWQPGGRANEIALGDAVSRNVPVFIQTTDKNTFGKGIGGLLGLSFLGNFNFSMNKGVLQLKPLD